MVITEPWPKPHKFIWVFIVRYFRSCEGLYGQNRLMGKFEVDAFNCFQNKPFQEAGKPVPLGGEWETGSSPTLGSPQEVWSRSICGEVFSLHVYYVWQRWQRPIHRTRCLMHSLSLLQHRAAISRTSCVRGSHAESMPLGVLNGQSPNCPRISARQSRGGEACYT